MKPLIPLLRCVAYLRAYFGLLALALLLGAGCAERRVVRSAPLIHAPPGMIKVKDSNVVLVRGVTIYNNIGGVLGVIKDIEGNHRFPNGDTDIGYLLKRPESDTPFWYPQPSIMQFWVPSAPSALAVGNGKVHWVAPGRGPKGDVVR